MNRRRGSQNLSSFSLLVIVSAVAVAVTAGILFAFLKNRQIEVAREIERVDERIAKHELDIKTSQMRMDQMLNRYVIRDRLQHLDVDLVAIPAGAIETVVPHSSTESAVALARP